MVIVKQVSALESMFHLSSDMFCLIIITGSSTLIRVHFTCEMSNLQPVELVKKHFFLLYWE